MPAWHEAPLPHLPGGGTWGRRRAAAAHRQRTAPRRSGTGSPRCRQRWRPRQNPRSHRWLPRRGLRSGGQGRARRHWRRRRRTRACGHARARACVCVCVNVCAEVRWADERWVPRQQHRHQRQPSQKRDHPLPSEPKARNSHRRTPNRGPAPAPQPHRRRTHAARHTHARGHGGHGTWLTGRPARRSRTWSRAARPTRGQPSPPP